MKYALVRVLYVVMEAGRKNAGGFAYRVIIVHFVQLDREITTSSSDMHTLICQYVVHGEPPPLGGGQSCWHKGVVTLTVRGWKPPSFRYCGKRAMALLKDGVHHG